MRPENNYCAHCGMPVDPAQDQPLFIVEGLTSLFNVVFFESLLEQELNRAMRYGHPLSVLVAEVDGLSDLEAAYGYSTTNELVRKVGETIANAIRDPDTLASTSRVAALGTQRFLVLMPETDEEGAFSAAEKIRSLVTNHPFELGDGPAGVTVSIGVASATGSENADVNLLARGTQALIESRAKGPNRVQVAAAT